MKPQVHVKRATARELSIHEPLAPSMEDACDWLNRSPSLDEVAACLRKMRMVHRELGQVIDLLRQHALIELGERSQDGGFAVDEPF